MRILQERSFDNTYIGKAVLENGVILYVNVNGYADGSDGQRYVGVFREDNQNNWYPIGWTSDTKESVLIHK